MTNRKLFDKLAGEENQFLSSQFLAPVLRGHPVRVRISGAVVSLKVAEPRNFEGWGVFRPLSHTRARFVREPNLGERKQYLRAFRPIRLILCRKENQTWLGLPFGQYPGVIPGGLLPLAMPQEVQNFDVVISRFDGVTFWFEEVDENHDSRHGIYLRESLATLLEPEKIELPGLTQAERDAYLLAYAPALAADQESKRDKDEERLKSVLERAGAVYQSYVDRGDTYTVEYLVGNDRIRSTVKKEDLGVVSAGICLSGGDSAQDLGTLVPTIMEGQRRRQIVRVGEGQNLTEERYRDMYGDGHRAQENDDWDNY
jgi:hypothetical protein